MITGAASGIGKACARRFAESGYRLALLDKSETGLAKIATDLQSPDDDCLQLVCDVSQLSDLQCAVATIIENWQHVDVLVANAGIQVGGSILEISEADWHKTLDVNLNGAAYTCKAVIPAMRTTGKGSIVITSSTNALVGSAGMTIYDMSKAGVLALMRSLAAEFGGDGIRANAVSPGNTITDFHINRMAKQGVSVEQIREMTKGYGLLGRAAEPIEVANAVYFLGSDQASFITGHNLIVDGGFSVTGQT